ncbi:MAG: SpoIIE family protein phosphatase [Clostridia bacterium]|jgi:serine/threonine protein phosphatase PrpC|nr:SpoIIE family protein phosphatase [Clostridia bacterium]
MSCFIDVGFDSINKHGEELCGDKVEIIKGEDGIIIVLADGLGSGVKANILATLTSKIAGTMLRQGASIHETVDTIVNTLPVCNVRKLAYSTFTILKIYKDGRIYSVEYDNPPLILVKDKRITEVDKKQVEINGRMLKESNFHLQEGDVLTIISDGVVHAGVGAILNLGWQWSNVADYIGQISKVEKCAKNISKALIDACQNLYDYKAGDDATVVTVKLRRPEVIDLFTGPPKEPEEDCSVVKRLVQGIGRKVVCGGTAANIVSRELGQALDVSMEFPDPEIPPIAYIKGIDLVTEGVLTLSKTIDKMKAFIFNPSVYTISKSEQMDGASQLTKLLIEDCTHLNLWVGTAVNPAHQNPDFPSDLSIKGKVVEELAMLMKQLGKEVKLTYI